MKCCIAMTTSDNPKIKVTSYGAEVTFDIYEVSIDDLKKLIGKELEIEIRES